MFHVCVFSRVHDRGDGYVACRACYYCACVGAYLGPGLDKSAGFECSWPVSDDTDESDNDTRSGNRLYVSDGICRAVYDSAYGHRNVDGYVRDDCTYIYHNYGDKHCDSRCKYDRDNVDAAWHAFYGGVAHHSSSHDGACGDFCGCGGGRYSARPVSAHRSCYGQLKYCCVHWLMRLGLNSLPGLRLLSQWLPS